MTAREKIEAYLFADLHREKSELERRSVDSVASFVHNRALELYWTMTRHFGFGHLHEGRGRDDISRRPAFAGHAPSPPESGRVLLDATALWRFSFTTGVQRVVRELANAAVATGAALPVIIQDGRLFSYYRHENLPDEIELARGDRFVLLDAGWGFADEYAPIMEAVRRADGETIGVVYDIIPLLYPAAVAKENGAVYRQWFETVVTKTDAIVAISRSVGQDVRTYAGARAPRRIGWWPLGADFAHDDAAPSGLALHIGQGDSAFFLSVGTLEPRKGYPVAMEGFERLWRDGSDARYVIVGRRGWNTRALQRAIREHPEYGRKLIWLDNASDADLRYLYARARAVICASFAEGFGLPLVEAAHYGAPVIASDIPVFREVAGDTARYFDLLDPGSLASRLREELSGERRSQPPNPISWRQSVAALTHLVRGDAYQLRDAAVEPIAITPNAQLNALEEEVRALSEAALDERLQRIYDRLVARWR